MKNSLFEHYQKKLDKAQETLNALDKQYGQVYCPESFFQNFHRACENVGKCGRDIYRYSSISTLKKKETVRKIESETFPVKFYYRDPDHFSFVMPKLIHKKHGSLSSYFNTSVGQQIIEYAREYNLTRKRGRALVIVNFELNNAASIDYDNSEKTRLLNTLVDTILYDDRKDSYSISEYFIPVDSPEDEKCVIHVITSADIQYDLPFIL